MRLVRILAALTGGFVLLGALYLLFYPVPFEPVAYTPPPNPGLTGDFAPDERLSGMEHLVAGAFPSITSVNEYLDHLYLVSIATDSVGFHLLLPPPIESKIPFQARWG